MKRKPAASLVLLVSALAILCTVLCIVVAVLRPRLLWVVLLLLAAILAVLLGFGRQVRSRIAHWLHTGAYDESKMKSTLEKLATPALLLSGKTVLWYNAPFRTLLLNGEECILENVSKALPGLDLAAGAQPEGQLLQAGERFWRIHSSTVVGGADHMSVVLLTDETHLQRTAAEYAASRPGCLLISVDGYEDVLGVLRDSERSGLLEGIHKTLEDLLGRTTGFLRSYGTGRFLALVEERHLEQFAQARYDVLDRIRALDESVNLSVSIGVGRGGATLHECYEMAVQALDMAQGRGGDQVAEHTPDGYTFYGGVSHGVEKRSRVKSRLIANALVDLIKEAESVVIMGHKFSDLDSVGAAEGVLRICKICKKPAVIALKQNATLAKSLIDQFIAEGCGSDFIEPEQVLDVVNEKTLCVVVDTYRRALVESSEVLDRCGAVVVIDHHRKAEGFIEDVVLLCHEPYASSASELVTELLQYVGGKGDKPTRTEAEGLLAGIMLDTRSFSLHTGVRTFEAAANLRRCGAETERVKALFNTSLEEYKAKCVLVEKAQTYKGCAISVSGPLPPEMKVAVPQAANDLLSIEGVQASFVAVENPAGVSISARSMGEMNVQVVMEALGGGGHQTMAGGQLRGATADEAARRICAAIDLYRAAQKQSNPTGKK